MKKATTWMESHPVLVGLLGTALGFLGTWFYQFVTEKAEAQASEEWESKFNTWREMQENEQALWRKRQQDEHDTWRQRREERIDSDASHLSQRAADALLIVGEARASAQTTKAQTEAAQADLKELSDWSGKIRKNPNELAENIKDLLLEDGPWKNGLANTIATIAPPIGTIIAWPTDRAPDGRAWEDSNWRKCNGALMDPNHYCRLLSVLGGDATPYGKEGGKFKLPDFRGCFLRGTGEVSVPQELYPENQHRPQQRRRAQPIGTLRGDRYSFKKIGEAPRGTELNIFHPDETETVPVNYAVHWIIRVR